MAEPHDRVVPLEASTRRAVDAGGTVENEFRPVWVSPGEASAVLPDPAATRDVAWVPWDFLIRTADETPQPLSPWAVLQVPLLASTYGTEKGAA